MTRLFPPATTAPPEGVHAEANAIISAARSDTLGATLYLSGRDAKTGQLLGDTTSCSMCRRLIINAGIDRVIIRSSKTAYSVVHVEDWIREDDTMPVDCGCNGGKASE